MFIRTERLFLRPGWAEDSAELHAGIGDEGIVRNLCRAPWPYEPQHARDFVEGMDPRSPAFLVTLPGEKGAQVIGGIGLAKDAGATELGYWIARDHWGRGYAAEAGRAVLSLARTLGHRRIEARHFADNPASGRVLRKLGFRPTGAVVRCASAARTETSPSIAYAVELGGADCDGDGNGMAAKRAA